MTDVGHHYGVLAYHAVQALKWWRPERPSHEHAAHCARSEHLYGTMTELHWTRARIERLGRVTDEALGPPLQPEFAARNSRRVVLVNFGLSPAFGWDAWNKSVGPGPKFPFPALSGNMLDRGEPDQRPGFGWAI